VPAFADTSGGGTNSSTADAALSLHDPNHFEYEQMSKTFLVVEAGDQLEFQLASDSTRKFELLGLDRANSTPKVAYMTQPRRFHQAQRTIWTLQSTGFDTW
jgi:hypothetical protein